MAEFAAELPPTGLLVRTAREGLKGMEGPIKQPGAEQAPLTFAFKDTNQFDSVMGELKVAPLFSPDGAIVIFNYEGARHLALHDSFSGALLRELPLADAQYVSFSPLGTYLITWSRPARVVEGQPMPGNLRVWEVGTAVLVASFQQRAYKPLLLQWSADEALCMRLVTNEVQIYSGESLSLAPAVPLAPLDKVYHKGLSQFRLSPTYTPYASVAVFNPEAGGKPARVSLYRYTPGSSSTGTSSSTGSTGSGSGTSVVGPVSARTIFAASEASMEWNCSSSALLIFAHADVDKSSYYGATGLFLMQAHSDAATKVEQAKDGPVHEVQWSPAGDRYDKEDGSGGYLYGYRGRDGDRD
jgi:translation initiation factor 2A